MDIDGEGKNVNNRNLNSARKKGLLFLLSVFGIATICLALFLLHHSKQANRSTGPDKGSKNQITEPSNSGKDTGSLARFYFPRVINNKDGTKNTLVSMLPDGSDIELTDIPEGDPIISWRISPGTGLFYFYTPYSLYTMDLKTFKIEKLFDAPNGYYIYELSPDCMLAQLSNNSKFGSSHIIDLKTEIIEKSREIGLDDLVMLTDKQIIYRKRDGGKRDIIKLDMNNPKSEETLASYEYEYLSIESSSNGNFICLTDGEKVQLYKNSKLHKIVQGNGIEKLSMSPDGTMFAWVEKNQEKRVCNVFNTKYDITIGTVKLPVDFEKVWKFMWSPDKKYFYILEKKESNNIFPVYIHKVDTETWELTPILDESGGKFVVRSGFKFN